MTRTQTRHSVSIHRDTAAVINAWAARLNTSASAIVEYVLDDNAPRPISATTFHAWNAKRLAQAIAAEVGRRRPATTLTRVAARYAALTGATLQQAATDLNQIYTGTMTWSLGDPVLSADNIRHQWNRMYPDRRARGPRRGAP